MKIMKFGGTSMADADCIRQVGKTIIHAAGIEPVRVVVSACQGVTSQLLECAILAAQGKKRFRTLYSEIATRHLLLLQTLLAEKTVRVSDMIELDVIEAAAVTEETAIQALLVELEKLLQGVWLLREAVPSTLDHIASFGERLSARMLTAWLQNARHPAMYTDTRTLIVTDDHFTAATVNMDETARRAKRWQTNLMRTQPKAIPIMTGFIAATRDGRTTTIGRNGSDYSAAILGAVLGARVVEIWTDVDGVYSADPNLVRDAFVVAELSYEEAMELSHFGAKVLHPATLVPLRDHNIPVHVRNTFRPDAPGTIIASVKKNADPTMPASGITSIDGITLLTWSGKRRVEISATVERLFRVLAVSDINIFFISQASSQHTLTLAISSADASRARDVIRQAFRAELKQQLVKLEEKSGQMIIAIVGDNMQGVPGVAGKMFHSLGQQGISIRAIAQGASEHNISLVIDAADQTRALNLVHDAFFLKEKKLGLVIVGTGNVGSTLLNMLAAQQQVLRKRGFHLQICALANSRRMLIAPSGIPATEGLKLLAEGGAKPFNLDQLIDAARHSEFLPLAFVDCTASSELVYRYPDIIRAGMHIVTPNKKANVLPWPAWSELMADFRQHERHFLYQTNVGAGLPVLSTLKDLLAGGDTIIKIEGILSGTLSYLFNTYDGSQPFAEVLRQTQIDGLTEPDPREDLSGMDVARKLVIMAREMGLRMELEEVEIENLVPDELRAGHFREDFYTRYGQYEKAMRDRLDAAKREGKVLRYVGTLYEGKARAGLQAVPANHPLAFTRASDNIIALTTDRYQVTPLVIQGLGAGAPVTAMGVFSDILRLLHYLPY